jgi:hypothetical protein
MNIYKVKISVNGYIFFITIEAYHEIQAEWWALNKVWKYFQELHPDWQYPVIGYGVSNDSFRYSPIA